MIGRGDGHWEGGGKRGAEARGVLGRRGPSRAQSRGGRGLHLFALNCGAWGPPSAGHGLSCRGRQKPRGGMDWEGEPGRGVWTQKVRWRPPRVWAPRDPRENSEGGSELGSPLPAALGLFSLKSDRPVGMSSTADDRKPELDGEERAGGTGSPRNPERSTGRRRGRRERG